MNSIEKNNRLIEMAELCQILKTKDVRTAIKWCEEFKIPILFVAKKRMTYRFLVETQLDKQIIQTFKKQSPHNWEYLYECYRNNDPYRYMLETQVYDRKKSKMATIRKPQSKNAKNLLKD